MRGCSRRPWLRLALASVLTVGAYVTLLLQSVPAQAAPVGLETSLTGLTSQGFPSYFRISPNGKMIDNGQIALGMSCISGAQVTLPDFVSHLRIGPSGRVHIAVNVPPTSLSGGGTYSGTDSVFATVNRKRSQVAGVWRLQLSYTFTDGTTDQCDSGPVRFVDIR
jgi:hypothetical protein